MLLGLFVVPTDFEKVTEHVRMFFGFFVVSMDRQMVTESVRMFFGFFVVPMDFEMVQDGAAAASNLIECKIHNSRSISHFSVESEGASVFLNEEGKKREEREEDQEKKDEKRKLGIMTPALVSILVQGVDGRHLSVKVVGGSRVSALCVDLAKMTGIPMDDFYLTRQAKVLQNEDELWLEADERLCMRERLRGGMDGDWPCQHCGRQGCWVTKVRCYRCGKSKFDPPPCLGGSEFRLDNRQKGSGLRLLGVQGLDRELVGNLWVRNHHRRESKAEDTSPVTGPFAPTRRGIV